MISDVLTSIEGLEICAVFGLIIFLLAFAAVLVWVFRLDTPSLRQWSRLPLDNQTTSDTQGAHEHE